MMQQISTSITDTLFDPGHQKPLYLKSWLQSWVQLSPGICQLFHLEKPLKLSSISESL